MLPAPQIPEVALPHVYMRLGRALENVHAGQQLPWAVYSFTAVIRYAPRPPPFWLRNLKKKKTFLCFFHSVFFTFFLLIARTRFAIPIEENVSVQMRMTLYTMYIRTKIRKKKLAGPSWCTVSPPRS